MKRVLRILAFCFLAGCAGVSQESAVATQNKTHRTKISRPESVVRSGRKDPLLKADYVLQILGEPTVKRREEPSEVWVYTQAGCVLFIFMQDQKEGAALVRHMEIGTPTFSATQKDSLPCLRMAAKLR